jgi:alpha-beta hydrolase superfamily lysophospholipase
MKLLLLAFAASAVITVIAPLLALVLGGPAEPAPMASINNPFKTVDFSGLPAPKTFVARDGTRLAYREYLPRGTAARGSVVLVHGSSATGTSMHVLARALAHDGYASYALDIRGHGGSGSKGRIAYVGQLEDDLEDFRHAVELPLPATLAGFSSGGGFVLRFAGSPRQALFSNYLLLSPYLGPYSPTTRPDSGGWASVGVPRYAVLSVLDRLGVHAFETLPVVKFSLSEQAKAFLTPQYTYALAENFRPRHDYRANLRDARQPMQLLVGDSDEAFRAGEYAPLLASAGQDAPVTVLPGIGHIGITLEQAAVRAALQAVGRLQLQSVANR